jgi:hypothetical protein
MCLEQKIENFSDKLLETFEKCLLSKQKSIGVTSTHYNSHQQKLIIVGLNHFNNNHPDLKIGIVSFSIDSGYFRELKLNSSINQNDRFNLISWQQLLDTNTVQKTAESFDILIWDLPEIQFLSRNSADLKESLESLDSLFIISNRLKTQDDSAFKKSISQYFLNHGLNISTILTDSVEKPRKIKTSIWARYFRNENVK